MFNLQGSEIIVILLLALVVLGPEKLPDAIRRFSRTYAELKKMGSGFQSELKSALDEPMREMRETADLVMNAADPQKLSEEAEAEIAARTLADEAAREIAEPIDERAFLVNDPGFERAAADADAGEPIDGADDIAADDIAADVPVNRVAAANSSAAIAAAASARDEAGTVEDVSNGEAPRGPAFQSAAPRRVETPVDQQVDGAVIDDATDEDATEEATAS